jgi:heparanase
VSLLIINTDRSAPPSLMLPSTSERYTLDAASLRDTTVRLNGRTLEVGIKDDLPRVASVRTVARTLTFEPATITFLAIPAAANSACR